MSAHPTPRVMRETAAVWEKEAVKPLRDSAGNLVQEIWSKYHVEYLMQDYDMILQPGQYLYAWSQQQQGNWINRKCVVSTLSAKIMGNRPIVSGGGKKLSSYPTLEEWDNPASLAIKGQAARLQDPGGFRKMNIGSLPTLVAAKNSFHEYFLPAYKFRQFTKECDVFEGCPIRVVTPSKPALSGLGYEEVSAYDVIRDHISNYIVLPVPIVLSDAEDVVLAGYDVRWFDNLRTFYKQLGIEEVGIYYKGETANTQADNEPPKQVWRAPIAKDDLGFSTLDPDIFDRMLPFDGHTLVTEYL